MTWLASPRIAVSKHLQMNCLDVLQGESHGPNSCGPHGLPAPFGKQSTGGVVKGVQSLDWTVRPLAFETKRVSGEGLSDATQNQGSLPRRPL